jgi:hypothetical protein
MRTYSAFSAYLVMLVTCRFTPRPYMCLPINLRFRARSMWPIRAIPPARPRECGTEHAPSIYSPSTNTMSVLDARFLTAFRG